MLPPDNHTELISSAAEHIAARVSDLPRAGVVLGSGLGDVADSIEAPVQVPYDEIPGWPVSTAPGHVGQLVIGTVRETPVVAMQGRAHLYEGYAPWQVAFPTRVLATLGCRVLILTNAAGAVNRDFEPGELMLIRDHLNLQGSNPCTGPNLDQLGERFFDMGSTYDRRLGEMARRVATHRRLTLQEGVYAALLGPSFETPAEIHMLGILGADAVGMSTVPEAIAATHAGVQVLGISCITNMAAGITDAALNHEEVLEVGARVRDDFVGLLGDLLVAVAASMADD
jgi:purine-nucleoside phosphorylase